MKWRECDDPEMASEDSRFWCLPGLGLLQLHSEHMKVPKFAVSAFAKREENFLVHIFMGAP